MTTEETQARLLAQWLSQPPGTDPPEGLDENVVSAVYSARPDRAPTPRTTLADILGAVRTGPYAQRAKFAVVSTAGSAASASIEAGTTPGEEGSTNTSFGADSTDRDLAEDDLADDDGPSGELVSLNAARERIAADAANREVQKDVARAERARKARRWWMGPMFAAGVAAAAVLVVVAPVAGLYLSPSASRLAETMTLSSPSPAVAPSAAPTSAGQSEQSPDVGAAPMDAPLAEMADAALAGDGTVSKDSALAAERERSTVEADPAGGPQGGVAGGADAAGYLSDGDSLEKSAKGAELRREDAPRMATEPPPEPGVGLASPAPGRTASPVEERQRVSAADEGGIAEMQEAPAQVETKSDSWSFGWGKKESAKVTDDEAEESVAQAAAPPKAPAKPAPAPVPSVQAAAPSPAAPKTSTTKAKSAPSTDAAPAATEAGAYESRSGAGNSAVSTPTVAKPAPATPPVVTGATGSTPFIATTTRSAGVPRDYSSYSSSRADVLAAYAAADAAKRSGNIDGAVAAYSALVSDSDIRVGQESAIRAAGLLRSIGRNSEALAMVERGLARSSSNTAQRSQLFVLKGDLLSAQGNASGAQAAWAEASRLNAGRYAQ